MRVFISSTPGELEPHRQAAAGAVRELSHQPVVRDPAGRRGLDPVTACDRQVAGTAAVLAIVGWRRGPVPTAVFGGDGLRPWIYWEVRSAFEHGLPVVALLAGERLEPELRDETPEARAAVLDLRGELARLGATFDDESDVRKLVRAGLRDVVDRVKRAPGATPAGLELRRHRPAELPALPYPLLLPYNHPDLMAGRDGDLAGLRRVLARPVTAVGLHAASGTGKSSLLTGALVPALRAEGRPVALVRHPAEAGLAQRLLGDLVEGDLVEGDLVEGDLVEGPSDRVETGDRGTSGGADAGTFVDRLAAVHRLAGGRPPVLVIDQLEDLLKDGAEADRADLGMLLAASAQRLPGADGPACRWLLAYRQEFHGRLVEWLEDVLREARAAGREGTGRLPHDLSGPARFVAWPLRPLASPAATSDDPVGAAARVFLAAIEKPLRLADPLSQRKIYPWTFAPGDAQRLARAFAEARVQRPDAPLVPELQVVLAHLLEQAGEPIGDDRAVPGEDVVIEVPEEPAELIDRALEDHLRRALDLAFPQALDAREVEAARIARTRALLVLRELAAAEGRRGEGRAAGALARALGEQGHEVLEKLSTPRTRLVLLEQHAGSQVYVLAHDRLAEVLVKVVDEGGWAGLGIDAELLALRRLVALQSQLHASGDAAQATLMPARRFRGIEANRQVLLWTGPQRTWWRACRARRRLERRRSRLHRVAAAAVTAAVALGAWQVADRRASRRALLDEVATGEPEAAFAALDRLALEGRQDRGQLVDRLRERQKPFDVFERGLGGVGAQHRAEALVRVAELARPILEASPEDPVLLASLLWALDLFAARDAAFTERAAKLRHEVLGPLRRSRPPPPRPAPGDPSWADIPAGSFRMAAGPGRRQRSEMQHQVPRHEVALSAFRMMTHEVTNAEYRRFEPGYAPGAGDDLPVRRVDWFKAYTYAAWLGGRLPTEAEWDYAARAGCVHAFCRHDGSETTLGEVAWWAGNAADPETGESSPRPVMRLAANPWGLWDLYGNLWEWSATWSGAYPQASAGDPPGPTDSSIQHRVACGGAAWSLGEWVVENRRTGNPPSQRPGTFGFRVVISNRQTGHSGITTRKPR